jgi:hypothetical protein
MIRLLMLFQIFFVVIAHAQGGKIKPSTGATVVITFTSSWGPVKTGNAPAAQVASIAPAAIFVKDNAGVSYPVKSFRLNYKFKSAYKDDETEELKYKSDLRVGEFTDTAQLSNVWIESIKDNVKAGDTILINKILFRNKAGKFQMAPDIRIAVN